MPLKELNRTVWEELGALEEEANEELNNFVTRTSYPILSNDEAQRKLQEQEALSISGRGRTGNRSEEGDRTGEQGVTPTSSDNVLFRDDEDGN